jgi:hypothetical protein
MNRSRCFGFVQITALIALLSCVTQNPVFGQQLPVPRGATVRVLRPNFEGASVWSEGRVVYASRDSLLLAETDSDPLVRFNESLRLQIRSRRSMTAVGGIIGLAAGLTAGYHLSGTTADNDGSTILKAVAGAFLGGALGTFVGSRIKMDGWKDVPLEETRRSIAPLNEIHTRPEFSLSRAVRWALFEPTVADFQAFFAAHADSLDPVEGIWVREGTNVGIAIVRVIGTDEEKFAAYTLMQRPGYPRMREDGMLVFALGRRSGPYDWYFQVPRTSRQQHRADMIEGVLDLFYPTGVVVRWEKLGPH